MNVCHNLKTVMKFKKAIFEQKGKKTNMTILTVIMGLLTKTVCEILAMVFSMAAIVNMVEEDDVIF